MANINVCPHLVPLSQVPHRNCEDYTPQFEGEITNRWLKYPWRMKMPVKCFRYKEYKRKGNLMLFK